MKITVAIPCYNLQDRISACLESVIVQNYKDIEILVIDDCSTDKSVEVVNGFIALHPEREFRFILNETNQGLCKVRNIAIKEASGDALYYLDGDDTIEPGTLSLFQRRMEEMGGEIVCGSFRKKDADGNTFFVRQYTEDTIHGDFALATYICKHISSSFDVAVWNKLYKLDFLRSNNICCATTHRTYESSLFTFKVALYARHISYIHDITYNQFSVQTSVTHQKKDITYLHTFQAIIQSIFDAKRDFEDRHELITHPGLLFLISNICMTNGKLKMAMEADIEKAEKKRFLKWLKGVYRRNDMKWSRIVWVYNKISYIILMSPFPFSLFRFYFRHVKAVAKIVGKSAI